MWLCSLKTLNFQEGGTNLAELLSSALPSSNNRTFGKDDASDLNGRSDGQIAATKPDSVATTLATVTGS